MHGLVIFFAAMFVAHNALAAARACIVQFAAEEHAAVQAAEAKANAHLCPESGDAAGCLTHCTQIVKNDQQKFWSDVPGALVSPAPAFLRLLRHPEPVVAALALAPPAGPPLTILFHNLRN